MSNVISCPLYESETDPRPTRPPEERQTRRPAEEKLTEWRIEPLSPATLRPADGRGGRHVPQAGFFAAASSHRRRGVMKGSGRSPRALNPIIARGRCKPAFWKRGAPQPPPVSQTDVEPLPAPPPTTQMLTIINVNTTNNQNAARYLSSPHPGGSQSGPIDGGPPESHPSPKLAAIFRSGSSCGR